MMLENIKFVEDSVTNVIKYLILNIINIRNTEDPV